MKRLFALVLCAAAFCAAAAPLALPMPFKKGIKTPVDGWKGQGTVIAVEKGSAVALKPLSGIQYEKQFQGKSGDKVVYEITLKRNSDFVSLRLGQWSKEGWIGDNFVLLKGGTEFTVAKGEIVLKDAVKPDKAGIIRKVERFDVRLYAHSNSKDVVIKDVKLTLVPGVNKK